MKNTKEEITRQTPFSDLREFLRAQEVRAYLGLGYNAVYKALERGDLPSRKIGGVTFIRKTDLLELSVA